MTGYADVRVMRGQGVVSPSPRPDMSADPSTTYCGDQVRLETDRASGLVRWDSCAIIGAGGGRA